MLRITRGDDKNFIVQFPAGVDLTGCTVYFTVKREDLVDVADPDDDNAVIKKQESAHTHPEADPENGKTVITLLSDDTDGAPSGNYVYDIQLKDSTGKIKTYKKPNGKLPPCKVTPQSTQRTD